MNKKKYITFGLIGLFALAFVSAGLVSYLSKTITGTVEVKSPLVFSGDVDWIVESGDAFNLIIKDFELKNNANTAISTIVETSITGIKRDNNQAYFSDVNVGEEFVTFEIGIEMLGATASDCEDAPLGGVWESSDSYCYWDASVDKAYTGVIGGVYYVQMGDGASIGASETMKGRMRFQFKTDVTPATYTFNTQALTLDSAKDL